MHKYAATWRIGDYTAQAIIAADCEASAREYAHYRWGKFVSVVLATRRQLQEHDECGGLLHRAISRQYSLLEVSA